MQGQITSGANCTVPTEEQLLQQCARKVQYMIDEFKIMSRPSIEITK
jgi:hypothetical protein